MEQSSTAETTTLTSAPTATDILIAGIERECLVPLVALLEDHSVDPTDAETLLSLLQRIGIDFSVARTALADTRTRHCVRCHDSFQECANEPEACVINVMCRRDSWKTTMCEQAGQTEEDEGKIEPVEVGHWHTEDPEDIEYSWLIGECERRGCNSAK